MKKILVIILLTCIFSPNILSAQDTIVLKDGNKIISRIIEVSDDIISYKRFNNLEGATFNLKTSNIELIIWGNGDIDKYKNISDNINDTIKGNVLPFILYKDVKNIVFDNNTILNESQFKDFLIENDLSNIWSKYYSGKSKFREGVGLLGGGIGVTAIGLGTLLISGGDAILIGSVVMAIGSSLTIASIPAMIVGSIKRNNSLNDYNERYAGKPPTQYSNITLNINPTVSGIGFTLNF